MGPMFKRVTLLNTVPWQYRIESDLELQVEGQAMAGVEPDTGDCGLRPLWTVQRQWCHTHQQELVVTLLCPGDIGYGLLASHYHVSST